MKKLLVILLPGFVFLNSCAKPTVVDSIMPGDEELNCRQLKNSVAEAQRFIKDAEGVKEVEGEEVTAKYISLLEQNVKRLEQEIEKLKEALKKSSKKPKTTKKK